MQKTVIERTAAKYVRLIERCLPKVSVGLRGGEYVAPRS